MNIKEYSHKELAKLNFSPIQVTPPTARKEAIMKSIAGSIVTLSGAIILTFGHYRDDAIMMIGTITMIVGAVIIFTDKPEQKKQED